MKKKVYVIGFVWIFVLFLSASFSESILASKPAPILEIDWLGYRITEISEPSTGNNRIIEFRLEGRALGYGEPPSLSFSVNGVEQLVNYSYVSCENPYGVDHCWETSLFGQFPSSEQNIVPLTKHTAVTADNKRKANFVSNVPVTEPTIYVFKVMGANNSNNYSIANIIFETGMIGPQSCSTQCGPE